MVSVIRKCFATAIQLHSLQENHDFEKMKCVREIILSLAFLDIEQVKNLYNQNYSLISEYSEINNCIKNILNGNINNVEKVYN